MRERSEAANAAIDDIVDAVRIHIELANEEGFETYGATPPGNPWARAYAQDMEMLLDTIEAVRRDLSKLDHPATVSKVLRPA